MENILWKNKVEFALSCALAKSFLKCSRRTLIVFIWCWNMSHMQLQLCTKFYTQLFLCNIVFYLPSLICPVISITNRETEAVARPPPKTGPTCLPPPSLCPDGGKPRSRLDAEGSPQREDPQQRLRWQAHLEFTHNHTVGDLTWELIDPVLPRSERLRSLVLSGIPHSMRPQVSGAAQREEMDLLIKRERRRKKPRHLVGTLPHTPTHIFFF